MKTISLCLIVKDEELSLQSCLQSVLGIVDEIIIVDTGSLDRTKEIAKDYTEKVYDFKWCDDFSAARNEAFSKAEKDFILWLDADDILLPADREKLSELKKELSDDIDVVMMKYNVGFDKNGNITFSYYRERLVKRANHFKWKEPVHEYIEFGGNVVMKDVAVTHMKRHSSIGRNIRIYESIIQKGVKLSTRGLYYYAKELYETDRKDESVNMFENFLERQDGWIEDCISSCWYLSECYKVLGEQRKRLSSLCRSFEYGIPRAEICCSMGLYYMDYGDYKSAIYWYTCAKELEIPKDCWGFIIEEYWNYVPLMQLCVLYDRLGETEKAIACNEQAAFYKPESEEVKYNREYFNGKLSKQIEVDSI